MGYLLQLPEQLPRKLYERVNKILEACGGKWQRRLKGHEFRYDPTDGLLKVVDEEALIIVKEGWFPTPPVVVEQMLMWAPWEYGDILEPSAGEGAIAEGILQHWADATFYLLCIEKNAQRARTLTEKGFSVLQGDFLAQPLAPVFQRVYANPPFEQGQDMAHVVRAYDLLAPGGILVSVMSESPFFQQTWKAQGFRDWLAEVGGENERLEKGSFIESGTEVNARLVRIAKGE
jgi:hypothetical protein